MNAFRLTARSRIGAFLATGETIEVFRARPHGTCKESVITQGVPLHRTRRLLVVHEMQPNPLVPRGPDSEIPAASGSRSRSRRGARKTVIDHLKAALFTRRPACLSSGTASAVAEDDGMRRGNCRSREQLPLLEQSPRNDRRIKDLRAIHRSL